MHDGASKNSYRVFFSRLFPCKSAQIDLYMSSIFLTWINSQKFARKIMKKKALCLYVDALRVSFAVHLFSCPSNKEIGTEPDTLS